MVKKKYEILTRDFFTCQKCGFFGDVSKLQLAHKIKQGKGTEEYIYNFILQEFGVELNKKQITEVINDELNLSTSCSKCNDYFNIFHKPSKRDKLLIIIFYNKFPELT